MRRLGSPLKAAIAALWLVATPAAAGETVEVLHWWTSGTDATALDILKRQVQADGLSWQDMPVIGGGREQALSVLQSRTAANNPPHAVQSTGFEIEQWADQGALGNLNRLAKREGWGDAVPEAVQRFARHAGNWVSVPVSITSTNRVWANKAIFDELGLNAPTSWEEFVAALTAIRDAGYVALAHGGQAWQDTVLFETIVMSVGGPDLYRAAFLDRDPAALGGRQIVEAFNRMAILRGFVDDGFTGRDWNLASAMVIEGEAGLQITGDWAKTEFLAAGLEADKDFLCFRFPGFGDGVTFAADQFALFSLARDRRPAQAAFASAIMSPALQSAFNASRGSLPARTDISDEGFDACARKAMHELAAADASGTLLGSVARGHATPAPVSDAILAIVTAHFNGEYEAERAAAELASAVAAAR